jgi:lysine/ornithine N-monooxygenase
MAQVDVPSVDSVICQEVTSLVSCPFDELVGRLPAYSWAQVFAAVDRLSRQGTLTVSRTRCFGYILSIGPSPQTPQSSQDRKGQALFGSAQLIQSTQEGTQARA